MSTVLLDTNIVSFILKRDTRAALYAPLLEGNRLAVSFMTVAELFEWAATRRWGTQRRARLEQQLATYLIIPVYVELCRVWGNVRSQRQAIGLTIAPQDAWIAATGLRHALPLVSHNPSDFRDIEGLEVRSIIVR
jgi:tRNA(fMet)-specific endonuclease VapC